MQIRQVRVPAHLAPSLAQALRDSGRLALQDAPTPLILKARMGADAVRVFEDGRVEAADTPELRGLLVQCVKGVLPTLEAPYVVGVDESGMGGEAAAPVAAVVLMPSDARAELIVAGVCDSKQVAAARLPGLSEEVTKRAMRWQVLPVTSSGGSHAVHVARAIAAAIVQWDDEGLLPANALITIDQTDEVALRSGFGDHWDRLKERITIQPKADEEHVEVAAASILARVNKVPVGTRPAPQTRAGGIFHIGKWEAGDRDQVLELLQGLQLAYPDISKWIGKVGEPKAVWTKVEKGEYQLTVARMNGQVAGFCLTQKKDERNWKLSTFYVAHAFRGQKIGHRLLDIELRRLAHAKARRVMVTFAHEEFGVMWDFFQEHGFRVDGLSPQRYRDNSYEVVMGKRFRYGTVPESEFQSFAEHDLFRMQGFNVKALAKGTFLAYPTPSLVQGPAAKAARLLVRVTTSAEPEKELDSTRELAKKHAAAPVLVSSFGLPSDIPMPADIEVFDALVLERLLSPVQIDRPSDDDVVIPIRPEFARILFPDASQATLMPMKVGLRTTNVYYRIAKNHEGLRRGCRVFFYESDGKGIFGVAHLESVIAGSAKKVYNQTRDLGAWTLKEIEGHAEGKDVAAYRFSGFRALAEPVGIGAIQKLHPKFNPITTYRLPRAVGTEILKQGGIA